MSATLTSTKPQALKLVTDESKDKKRDEATPKTQAPTENELIPEESNPSAPKIDPPKVDDTEPGAAAAVEVGESDKRDFLSLAGPSAFRPNSPRAAKLGACN